MTVDDLRKLIDARTVSQAEICRAIGLSPDKLNKTLAGTRRLQVAEADAIGKFLVQKGLTKTSAPTPPASAPDLEARIALRRDGRVSLLFLSDGRVLHDIAMDRSTARQLAADLIDLL